MTADQIPASTIAQSIRIPQIPLPPGAWDCHAHVFGPFDAYPLLAERRYDPPLAPAAEYLQMLRQVGFDRGVLVHASACGYDNRCTGDALTSAHGRVIGVCVVQPSISDRDLEHLHSQGFRAVRVTETGDRARRFSGSLHFEGLQALAPRLRSLGWHVEVWASCERIVGAAAQLTAQGLPVVFDHMGYFNTEAGVHDPTFRSFVSLLNAGDFWVKMVPLRLSKSPGWEPIRPFHDRLLESAADRALFGSDWPHLSMPRDPARTARLIDLFDFWTPDPALRRRVLVDNPSRLYDRIGR